MLRNEKVQKKKKSFLKIKVKAHSKLSKKFFRNMLCLTLISLTSFFASSTI